MTYPKTVYIIRHAEETGDEDDIHLSRMGQRRSYALVGLFADGGRLAGVQYLIATDRSKHSNRCVETLVALGNWLHEDIDHHYDDDEFKDLAKRLKSKEKYAGSVVLICWHHGNIPALARALGVKAEHLPSKTWPDDVYDRVWILDYAWSAISTVRSELQEVEV